MNRPGRSASSPPASTTTAANRGWPLGALFALFVVALLVVYHPSLRGEMLWDDAGHVTNPALQSWSGLWRIWFEPGATQQYYPLLHSAFWFEHRVWGDSTLGYHVINVLWHALSACLLVALLRRLALPGAWLAGLLFALHPVCVESVAWISEQKNTLSTVFYLAAAIAWLRFEAERRPARYGIAALWFLAALLTKTVTATLPAALLVVAWWRRGRLSWRGDVLPLLPWFAAGIAAGLFTAWFEHAEIGAQGADFNLSAVERGLLAGRVVWFYFSKVVWPFGLVFFYPRWRIDAAEAWQCVFPLAVLALIAVLVWRTRRTGERGLLAAVLIYGGTLFPVLGFVNVYPFVFSYVADHFQYLASLSLFALASAGLVGLARGGRFPLGERGVQIGGLALAVLLGALTWRQSRQYVDSITLYRATLERNPNSWVAHHNLGMELAARGEVAEALSHARRAVELKPNFPEALNNLADNLTRTGQAAEALPLVEKAVRLQPRYAPAENTWGAALMTLGRAEEGIRHFRRAIELQPELAEAHYNLGLAYADRGDFTAAIAQFAETARLRPTHISAEMNWGVALAANGRMAEARPHFQRALDLDPGSAALRQTYGRLLFNTRDFQGAAEQFRAAQEIDPRLPGIERELAAAQQQAGRR